MTSSVTTTIKKKKFTGNPIAFLNAKAERQSPRNQNKLKKLKDFQSFNRRIDKLDVELDTIIAELEGFDDFSFKRKIFSILNIRRKGLGGLMIEESVGRKFYQYIPFTL